MSLEQTWRWFGPNDLISLAEIKQTGATGIVSALHHIPNGQVWSIEEIKKRKQEIEVAGLRWSVVESVPVHEDIKKRTGNYEQWIENYNITLRHLGLCGIDTVCYNFMPVLDWSRTQINYGLEDGKQALRYSMVAFACFDIHLLKRPGAEADYSEKIQEKAKTHFASLPDGEKENLINTVIQGLPGAEESFTLDSFQSILDGYKGINKALLKANLFAFLQEVIPVAEEASVRMAIHPDDPPWPLLGLPRIVSSLEDVKELTGIVDSPANGITLCTGSFGASVKNDLVNITKEMAHKINFVHLRNVSRDEEGNFLEDDHLNGDIDFYQVLKCLHLEELRRKEEGRADWQMPMRPDHGHLMLDDQQKSKINPGYSLLGRMKGLAELRGLEMGIIQSVAENR